MKDNNKCNRCSGIIYERLNGSLFCDCNRDDPPCIDVCGNNSDGSRWCNQWSCERTSKKGRSKNGTIFKS